MAALVAPVERAADDDSAARARRARAAFEFARLTAPVAREPLAPMPKPRDAEPSAKKLVGYREVCHNGRCYLVPVYEP
jgi:hypothetical protein